MWSLSATSPLAASSPLRDVAPAPSDDSDAMYMLWHGDEASGGTGLSLLLRGDSDAGLMRFSFCRLVERETWCECKVDWDLKALVLKYNNYEKSFL